jgi:hypothetical protein
MKLSNSLFVIGVLVTQLHASPAEPHKSEKNPAKCYGGGMEKNEPLSGKNTPPCWYKQSSGKYHCYDYLAGTKDCPWPGYEDPKPK